MAFHKGVAHESALADDGIVCFVGMREGELKERLYRVDATVLGSCVARAARSNIMAGGSSLSDCHEAMKAMKPSPSLPDR